MFDRIRGWWRTLPRRTALLWIGVAPLLALLIISFAWEKCFFGGCPDVQGLAAYQPGGAPVLLDRFGEVFADLTPVEQEVVPLFEMPAHVPQAFLAVEDRRFYEHHGVDWRRVGGSLMANLKSLGWAQGFSTITMQLARNAFPETIPGEERSTSRKFLEVRIAQEIEARYSKEEILELYLNHIYFGNRAQGIEAASHQYFGRSAKELTLPQAATLAALPKAPSHYDPRRHPRAALERRNLVLALMEQQGRIPRPMARAARNEPLGIAPAPRLQSVESSLAPWFAEQVRRELESRFGSDLYRQPLRIWTTLDSRAQRAAEEELSRQLKRVENGELGRFSGPRYSASAKPPPKGTTYLQGALVMLDARNGDVLAWVGGRNYSHSQFDRVALAQRQPGSAFKPFVYSAGLREGFVLSQPLPDLPLSIRLSNGTVWRPQNFTGRYEGSVTMRDALVRSKNVVTVRLASAVGIADVAGVSRAAGIDERVPEVPAAALGTIAVSPLELTAAYTPFASLGEFVEPRLVLKVEDENGEVLWASKPERKKVLDPAIAFLITDVLSEALRSGTGIGALGEGFKVPSAGKTGTTNQGADAWFVGYTPEIVSGIWIGFDRPRSIIEDATGGRLAAPIWGRVVQRFYEKRKTPEPWRAPEGVVARNVDPRSGLILKEGCSPRSGQPRRELFLEEMQPAAWCPGREAPPRNGFPVMRLMEEQRRRERETAQLAEARRIEEAGRLEEARRRQEGIRKQEALRTERQARMSAEQQKEQLLAEARKKEEEERLAQEREDQRLGSKGKEQEAEATLAKKQEQEEKRLDAKRREAERIARIEEEERRLAQREAEIAREERRLRAAEDREQRARDEEAKRPAREEEEEAEVAEAEEEEDVEESAASDLSGWWEMTNRIDETNYTQYKGLRLGYRVQLEQEGNRLTGRGQKWTEDGRSIGSSGRTPITVTGRIEGRKVTLNFTEHGAKRSTSGGFTWTLSADRTELRGSFWSTAAETRGRSTAVRMR
ncbi:MAG TPA: PBP1A family penicillin-binding protein [Thermoanaerobaculia bacterium]|nr:PBP1A family penicillin-binding protein [Thermoanaerobaculia bacterium]